MKLNGGFKRWIYGYVEGWGFGRPEVKLHPCVIFGVQCRPNRALGFHILLEGGAIYSTVPIHALRHREVQVHPPIHTRQVWDCFGFDFSLTEFPYLREQYLSVINVPGQPEIGGRYWTSLQFYNDGFSETPEQAKLFHFVLLDDGTIGCYPNTNVIVEDGSFNGESSILVPNTQTRAYYAES